MLWHVLIIICKCVCVFMSGIRMLRQDPVECLFSFICSSNNHISRIQGMVERLCGALGTPLCELNDTRYHDFPSIEALAGNTQTRLYLGAVISGLLVCTYLIVVWVRQRAMLRHSYRIWVLATELVSYIKVRTGL